MRCGTLNFPQNFWIRYCVVFHFTNESILSFIFLGFVGKECLPICQLNPCSNSSVCETLPMSTWKPGQKTYVCKCDAQHTGVYCETLLDLPCPSNWWGYPICGPCQCDINKGYSADCNKTTGECFCEVRYQKLFLKIILTVYALLFMFHISICLAYCLCITFYVSHKYMFSIRLCYMFMHMFSILFMFSIHLCYLFMPMFLNTVDTLLFMFSILLLLFIFRILLLFFMFRILLLLFMFRILFMFCICLFQHIVFLRRFSAYKVWDGFVFEMDINTFFLKYIFS